MRGIFREHIESLHPQRASEATGLVNDEYMYSLHVQRDEWSQLNFQAMRQIDVIAALGSFEMRCNMTVAGIFRPVNALTSRAPKQGVRRKARVG